MAIAGSGVNAMWMRIDDGKLKETKSSCASSVAIEDVDEAVTKLMQGDEIYVLLYGSTVPNVREKVLEKLGATDAVNHPSHYNALPVECIDVVEHYNFCIGSALKYLWRAGLKPGSDKVTDLQKARWFIDRELQRIESFEKGSVSE